MNASTDWWWLWQGKTTHVWGEESMFISLLPFLPSLSLNTGICPKPLPFSLLFACLLQQPAKAFPLTFCLNVLIPWDYGATALECWGSGKLPGLLLRQHWAWELDNIVVLAETLPWPYEGFVSHSEVVPHCGPCAAKEMYSYGVLAVCGALKSLVVSKESLKDTFMETKPIVGWAMIS